MNLRKIGVVLLALLLAGMAMVPMVSAVDERSQGSSLHLQFRRYNYRNCNLIPPSKKCRYPVNFIWIRGFRLSPQQSTSLPLS